MPVPRIQNVWQHAPQCEGPRGNPPVGDECVNRAGPREIVRVRTRTLDLMHKYASI
ncbi:hypothetical protein LC1Hm_1153 [Halomicrobium sp. LC1Hm]|nr:hypothetical protein LC1Hm_1153 [Halomicrobium sp. LC1Hm]